MDSISESRAEVMNPVVVKRIRNLEAAVGCVFRLTQGNRENDEQAALWAQGRLNLTAVNVLRAKVNWAPITNAENKKVTDAPPLHSWHEYGMAGDIVPMDPVPDWNTSHPAWQRIIELAPQFGLRDGISWKDEPHLQPVELPVSPTPIYIAMLQEGKTLQEIWDYANLPEEFVNV